ncbi:N-formylglutamate amidohydrolase [Ponticoccus alexandrii]|uniref:N-formylglutamate amidohydrolase n=1 Tax=Ponticoccus alexandrii TaxID=1943633 RepID=A0ABX7FBA8_9RHOB|nr:N-formylglutamate amidohydrolase [Ponticoccus alexandrii]ETA50865.1 N-formylglutamate amidohydrolase [Rhodobacteraceae bacterium PD-2]QRF67406.1 N-formylglutamate amidohydrolase [Ponticoccus alexandrii]
MFEGDDDGRDEAVRVINEGGSGGVLLLCEHASAHIPTRYGGLGLRADWRDSHAAWDPGALALAQVLSSALNAPLVAGAVSRLVYDCNRPPSSPSAMPERSEVVEVPGNVGLTPEARAERVESVYAPFVAAVETQLGRAPGALVTVHSFTPLWHGTPRETEIGLLHHSDARLAEAMLARAPQGRVVHLNRPYGPEDGVTHSLQLHGKGLPNVMIEARNDLLTTPKDVQTMAMDLLAMLTPALAEVADA